MRKFENLILGGGPVGILLGAIYGYPVITNEVKVPHGPIYLYDTPATRVLMKKLLLTSLTSKEISIGYWFRGKIYNDIPRMARLEYTLKMSKKEPFVPSNFKYFEVSWEAIFERAMPHIPEVIMANATTIDLTNRVIFDSTTGSPYQYENLISTIPAPLFKTLTGNTLPWWLKALPVTMVPVTSSAFIDGFEEFDYVYFCDYDDLRIRWSKRGYIESKTSSWAEAKKWYNMVRVVSGEISNVPNVKFMGRFAKWDESRLISDDVAEAIAEKIEVR